MAPSDSIARKRTVSSLMPGRQIARLLVANRGEIARRVFRSCRDLGIGTVAVFSDADADAPHVREADLAVRLPGNTPAETYLQIEAVVAAARATGADAVHPGYGFLSENAEFARAVLDAGLTWVGPPPEVIAVMGSKVEAKQRMAAAGVPLLTDLDPATVRAEDFPLLVKASAGGGGRGMRAVRDPAELEAALASARAEAGSAFGDETVFCEPLLEHAKHIEVQVLADHHGTTWILGERECSWQRRHQKVIEETPSPAVDPALREALGEAARSAAAAIGYVGAGTVEFLLEADAEGMGGRFFFLEMNTRLQVEHPVTECLYGVDLVALQLSVAEGERLRPEPPDPRGHAVEARLYAEDPRADWRPRTGTLTRFDFPGVNERFRAPGGIRRAAATGLLRLDSGVEAGSVVGVHYDAMLAKVIAWAPTREAAVRRLATALAGARIGGVGTNRDLLVRLLRSTEMRDGTVEVGLLDTAPEDWTRPLVLDGANTAGGRDAVQLSAVAAAAVQVLAGSGGAVPAGWRNVSSQAQRVSYRWPEGDRTEAVGWRWTRRGPVVDGVDGLSLITVSADEVLLEVAHVRYRFAVAIRTSGDDVLVEVDSPLGSVTLVAVPRFPDPSAAVAPGSLLAPMPGTVTRVAVEVGASVAAGQLVLVLEAMKMEHPVHAPADGTVEALPVAVGQQVDGGSVLAVLTEQTTAEE
ncbi:MAG: propionyl-CoA carboxylase alpha chain [Frankiaceae bacterium]|nr:propionyl-CoA carboxylase alpha chain [Frankiaceae bacterium]